MWVRIPPPALLSRGSPSRLILEAILHRVHLVGERLLLVAALVELQHRVDARQPHLEGDAVELGDDGEDVLGRSLEIGSHRVELVPDPVLGGEPALDLGDVLARARVGAPQPDYGELGGGHADILTISTSRSRRRAGWSLAAS